MTLLNYWHYFAFFVIFIIFLSSVIGALKQSNKKLIFPMIFSGALISGLLIFLSIVVIDKYTKVVKLYKVKNKRLLGIEKIVYTGIVKNEGKFPIGEVTFEIKLVNKGAATGNVKAGSFYKASGFFDMFSSGADVLYKPQSITKRFVVATNLEAGTSKSFRVHFDFPPYFRNVAQFQKVYGR